MKHYLFSEHKNMQNIDYTQIIHMWIIAEKKLYYLSITYLPKYFFILTDNNFVKYQRERGLSLN